MQRRYRYLLIIASIALVLLGARIALPHVILDYVNDQLAALEAYDGHVDDIDLSLWRGGYRIDGIRVVKTGAAEPTPFFASERVELSVEWRQLLRGSLVAQGAFVRPNLNLVQSKNERQEQLGQDENWARQFEELFPFRFNTVRVHDGTLTFRAPGIHSRDALVARAIHGELTNLTNVVASGRDTFAQFQLTAQALDTGSVRLDGSFDPLARRPTFDVNLTVRDVRLPEVNPWLRRFIKADAESGEFELYLELAAAEGRFKGYAKPLMHNVNIYASEEPEDNPLRRLWEGLVEFAANVLENEQEEQVAARIPVSGTIENPQAGVFAAITSVLRNAFVGAFARSLEGSISVRDVKLALKDVGNGSEGRDARKQEEEKKQRKKQQDQNDDKD